MARRVQVFTAMATLLLMQLADTGEAAELRFVSDGGGLYSFDSGVLSGTLSAGGKNHGIVSLLHAGSGKQLAHGVGVLNLYRLFSAVQRYGDAARSWPTTSRLLDGGAVEVVYPSAAEHPFEIRTVYRLSSADSIDLEIVVTPEGDMQQFELFQSSYFAPEMTGKIYVKPPFSAPGAPRFLSPDYHDMLAGTYLIFPRDEAAIRLIFDGRWRIPPHVVQWSISQWMAAPLALRTDPSTGVTAVVMARPEDCFAVAAPYNRTPPDGIASHGSLYFSLFGCPVSKAKAVRTRVRLAVLDQLEEQRVVERYAQFVEAD